MNTCIIILSVLIRYNKKSHDFFTENTLIILVLYSIDIYANKHNILNNRKLCSKIKSQKTTGNSIQTKKKRRRRKKTKKLSFLLLFFFLSFFFSSLLFSLRLLTTNSPLYKHSIKPVSVVSC